MKLSGKLLKTLVYAMRTGLLVYTLLGFFLIIVAGLVHFGFVHVTGASVMVKLLMTAAFLCSLADCCFVGVIVGVMKIPLR